MRSLTIDSFHDAFERFQKDLYKFADNYPEIGWVRCDRAIYNHKRIREFSVWYISSGQEFGHVFLAKVDWNGQVDWERIAEIIQDHNLAVGPFEDVKVWDLSNLKDQEKPEPRCDICGKIVE